MVPPTPVRLAYTLAFVPHSQRAILMPRLIDAEAPLSEPEVRAIRTKLHPLDIAIVQELLTGTVFGQLSDMQLARLVPVLAQRRTKLGNSRLSLKELQLIPRLRIEGAGRGVGLSLWLQQGEAGSTAQEDGLALADGRLLLGSQAYFLHGAVAFPVRAREPWALAHWTREPSMHVGADKLGPQARDALVRDLAAGGIPESDLEELAVHRGPPSHFVVRFGDVGIASGEPEFSCLLEAHYEQGSVVLGSQRHDVATLTDNAPAALTSSPAAASDTDGAQAAEAATDAPDATADAPLPADDAALAPAPDAAATAEQPPAAADAIVDADTPLPGADAELDDDEEDEGDEEDEAAVEALFAQSQRDQSAASLAALPMVERDTEAENDALRAMRALGFRLDRQSGAFVAQGELALRALDPRVQLFDPAWTLVRGERGPVFHEDLRLSTRASMREDQGLIDLSVDVRAVPRAGAEPPVPAADGTVSHSDPTVAALIDMQALLAWLHSGQRYIRLADGSFAAPSANFRQGLRILHDLGADSSRALVSPLCIGLLRAMGDLCALEEVDVAVRNLMGELIRGEYPQQTEAPEGLQIELRDYQRRGLDWLMMLHRHRLTGILADDMGLGKTLQTLALLLTIKAKEGQKPSLVVAPTSVVTVWRDEAKRFAPTLKVALWYGSPQERAAMDVSDADLVVTSYGVLRRDADRLGEVGFRYVILDEAQSTKNARSLGAHAIRQLKSERRLALSGTPLENRPEELWSIFDFLAPGFLGSLRKFRRTYALPISRGDRDAMSMLRLKIEPLVLRRLKKEVAKELPDKIESTVRCDMGPSQRALYDHVAGELKENIKEKIAQVGIEQAQLDILAALTRLRQICCDPALLPTPPNAKVPPSAKLQLFEELMREALASERAVVVFSQFVQMQRRLIDVVRRLGVEPLWLHGGTVHRDRVVAAFQDPAGPPVIVVSLKAGGTGLTLTRADTVMHYDPWWNPAVERQATDRAHRLGQTSTITVYRLVCSHSIEERVLKMAESKEALAADLLGSEGGPQSKHIGRDEILALLA